jgi:hypothetical protein
MWNHENKRRTLDFAHVLGWGSIGIGLCQLLGPRRVTSALGISDKPSHHGILRILGVRELMHGIGILTAPQLDEKLSAGVWSRVAGDVLDASLLGVAATKTKNPAGLAAVAAVVTAIGLADLYCASQVEEYRTH